MPACESSGSPWVKPVVVAGNDIVRLVPGTDDFLKAAQFLKIGSVETDVRVNRFSQTQSGLLNRQVANVGSVVDSNVIGSVKTNTRVNRLSQSQSGLLNAQKMSIGSVD